jgi:hypothetical protein
VKAGEDTLAFLLTLNQELTAREARGAPIAGPGLPACVKDPAELVSEDCVPAPEL